jgi:hypothetical protein
MAPHDRWRRGEEEAPNVCVKQPIHPFPFDPDRQRVQRVMRTAPRPETVGEAAEVDLIDGVQYLDDGA